MNISEKIELALDATGIRWTWGQRETGHLIIRPTSNLKPWTKEEQESLERAASGLACINGATDITYKMVRSNWEGYEAKPGFGFRVYTSSKAKVKVI